MKNIKIIIIVMGLLSVSQGLRAQQQVMFTQYMFNQLAINPAYAGIHNGISTSFLARHQWAGFDGAPRTQTFSIHSPVKYRPIALGAVVIHDEIGLTDQFGAYFSTAYRISFSNRTKLSFGLQASFNQYKVDYSENVYNDPNLASQNISDISPNAGAGLMWHSDKFYLGFSVPQLINYSLNSVGENSTDPDAKLIRHYFVSAGYVFELSRDLKLKPNLLFKWVQGAPFEIDINANFLIKELIWLGISYRSLDSFDALFQIQVTPQFQLGYSYDFLTTTDLSRVNSGSHEIMINYVFNVKRDKIVTPRYF
ncbi:type IX secretion system membrane protein, PorP/SprF family [Reichenbachiella agariperforans]|uniref:Type IX secretion system membrane protein, PorP/SprF family n=1 Tax=Reichenbachiella agariperforans TaxID=156994 RepID=A0A1M6QN81_REIAG|nr:type IX secretion system membrane protein PorP/SprF [Reichenbachiella agariperforans]SHK21543.1 type IX secretion system membrane protein, PorP/SprF family [Reichenbachiella agariperforans]